MTHNELNAAYQFPATRFTRNSHWRQWWHLVSEVLEVGRALLAGDLQHAAAELWDVKHSSETLHRIMEQRQVDVEVAQSKVLSNNKKRGYYLDRP